MIFINTAIDTTGLFRPFFPISIPYGVGHLMAVLREANIKFSFIDQQVQKDVFVEIDKQIQNHQKPYIFSISTLTESFSAARKISDILKNKYPDSVIIMGGLHPTSVPLEILNSVQSVDYVFAGEAETEIVKIYERIKSGQDIYDIHGLVYRRDDEIIFNNPPDLIKDIDSIPEFPYDIFAKYKHYNFGHIMTSRGCPYNCTFCCVKAVGKRRYRFKSAKSSVQELELLVSEFGQKEIAFFDDNLLANKKRIFDLCAEIRQSEILKNVRFSFQARTRDMDEEILQEMYNSGFKTIFFGIETVSDEILKDIGKDETHTEIESVIRMAQQIGFGIMANFLFCLPNETREVREACVEFAIRNKLELAKFNNVVPYPGTVMYDQTLEKGLDVHKDYINFNSQEVLVRPFYKKVNFPYLPEGTTSYGMRQEILMAYFRFYFRFKMLIRVFTKRSWGGAIFSYGESFRDVLKKIPAFILLLIDISIKFELMFLSVFSKNGIKFKDITKSIIGFFK